MLGLLTKLAVALAALAGVATAAQAPAREAAGVTVPPGYRAQVWATGLRHPTAMALGPGGKLYVSEDVGKVVIAAPRKAPKTFLGGLRTPLGLLWKGNTLFVSEQGRLTAHGLKGGRRVVAGNLPYGRHQQDSIVLGRDGYLYFGSGSTCDVCVEQDPRSAAILAVRPNGTGLHVAAHGLRNPYGLAQDPRTGKLYVSVNGQDEIGENEPAETVVAYRPGASYGWPRCWASWISRRLEGSCSGVTAPIAYLQPHSSADGIVYWNGSLYVAEWGEYLSHAHGRRVVRFPITTAGKAGAVTTFLSGLPHPLALTVAPDRSLLVADWQDGTITKITRR